MTGPDLLDEAVAELRKARDGNEKRRDIAAEALTYDPKLAAKIQAEVDDRSLEIADGFIRIEEARRPCCHHAQPEQEQQP